MHTSDACPERKRKIYVHHFIIFLYRVPPAPWDFRECRDYKECRDFRVLTGTKASRAIEAWM
jgi:hypothetical protein